MMIYTLTSKRFHDPADFSPSSPPVSPKALGNFQTVAGFDFGSFDRSNF